MGKVSTDGCSTMNITKKKNCNRCKAYKVEKCILGYDKENFSFDEYGFTAFGVPDEKCPKPLTYSDLIYAEKFYNK